MTYLPRCADQRPRGAPMTTSPAGWYPDPAGSGGLRWWNGVEWGEQVQPAPQPVVPGAPQEWGAGPAAPQPWDAGQGAAPPWGATQQPAAPRSFVQRNVNSLLVAASSSSASSSRRRPATSSSPSSPRSSRPAPCRRRSRWPGRPSGWRSPSSSGGSWPERTPPAAGQLGTVSGTAAEVAARAVWASTIPARTTAPPATCQPVSTCSTHSQATIEASTGSAVATIPAVVGGMCRSAASDSQNGSTAPSTTIQATSTQAGTCSEPSDTGTRWVSSPASNAHQGAAIAQNTAAATKLHAVSATGSRSAVPRSPSR